MGLSVFRQMGCDLPHVGPKPEGQHFVGFVENQHLQLGEVDATVAEMVEDPPRGSHDNVCARLQALVLGSVADATVDREATHAAVLADGRRFLGNLDRKLPGGEHDQRLGGLGFDVDRLANRYRERSGLAAAGEGLHDQVATVLHQRDGSFLNRHRFDPPQLGNRALDLLGETFKYVGFACHFGASLSSEGIQRNGAQKQETCVGVPGAASPETSG